MFRKSIFAALFLSMVLIISCDKTEEKSAASMEQLHAENGVPVSVRQLETEDFSVYLRYPAIINASSESTAYAAIDDVVRRISASVGQSVRQGDVIVSFSADNRNLEQAALAHENARAAYERSSALFRSNDISRQDFDSVRMQYEISNTNLRAANDMVYVKAPISGTITQINVRATQNVRPGAPLFTVSNNNAFEARMYVGIDEIEMIRAGARAFINPPRGRQGTEPIEGKVTQVSMIMDSQRQSFPVTVSFDGGDRQLVSGINVDIEVETHRNENAIVLARRELAGTETEPTIFVVEGSDVREVPVRTGVEKGLRVEITGGLNEGDIIVSEGVQFINAGSKINIVPSIQSNGQVSAGR